jgi:hypothetical protein
LKTLIWLQTSVKTSGLTNIGVSWLITLGLGESTMGIRI